MIIGLQEVLMLVKLTANQISDYWEPIKNAVRSSLPPTTNYNDEGMNEIFKSLLSDTMQCWALVGEQGNIKVIATTAFTKDIGTKQTNLLIYSLFATGGESISNSEWLDGWEGLKKFARERNVKKVLAYSNVPRVIDVVKSLGGRLEFNLISLEV